MFGSSISSTKRILITKTINAARPLNPVSLTRALENTYWLLVLYRVLKVGLMLPALRRVLQAGFKDADMGTG